MKRNSFGLLFFIKKGKPLKSGLVPIFLRVTVNGVSVESSTRRTIRPEQWNKSMECSSGRDRLSIEVNEYIRTLKLKLYTLQSELELSGAVYTSRLITDTLFGCSSINNRTLLSVFRKHNAECRALIGIDFVDITVRRYDNCAKYLAVLIREKYGKEDMALSEINGEFVRNFEFYLKTVRGCQQNTVIRYMKCFKKIIHLAIANEWLRKDPFTGIKFKEKQVNKEILSMEELEMLLKKEIEMPRIEYVRDVFLFCAFTGLAYVDVNQLTAEHIVKDSKGDLWIRKNRQKTKNMCNIPLLKIPQMIIEKHRDNPLCLKSGVLLPVTSNQKMNSYLKELATICSIKKNLTTHTASHNKSYNKLRMNKLQILFCR